MPPEPDEDPAVESEEDGIEDEEGSVGPEDPEFKFPGELEPPHQTTYAAQHLYEMLKRDEIDLDPEYQRGIVWAEKAQMDVIESYIKNYHVPPLLLKKTVDDKFVCMDGKQRMTSIKKFFAGELPIRSPEGKNLWYQINPVNKNRGGNLLPARYRKKMELMQISVNEYKSLTEKQEREMFQRVQYGMSLNVAEKLYALPGLWPDFVRDLYRSFPEWDPLWKHAHIANKRMSRFYAMVRLVWYLSQCGLPSRESIPNPGFPGDLTLRRWMEYEEDDEGNTNKDSSKPGQVVVRPTEEFEEFVKSTMNRMKRIANTKNYREVAFFDVNEIRVVNKTTKKRARKRKGPNLLSPVEFVCIGIFISRNLDMHLGKMSRNIHNLRNLIQRNYAGEKKWNARVIETFWNWIENSLLDDTDDGDREQDEKTEDEEDNDDDDDDDDGDGDNIPATPRAKVTKAARAAKATPQANGSVSARASQRSHKVGPPSRGPKKTAMTPRTPAEGQNKRRRVAESDEE